MNLSHRIFRHKWLILSNITWLTIYLTIINQYGWSIDEIIFSTPDSESYLKVGEFFWGGESTGSTLYRPFLYPVLLKSLLTFGDIYGLWIFQAVLWLLTMNLLFYSSSQIFRNPLWAALITSCFSLNISFIAFTMHALTETVTTFCLSFYLFFVSKNVGNGINDHFLLGSLLAFSVLTVIKPLYSVMALVILVIMLFKWRIFKHIGTMKRLFLILFPVFFQVGLVFFLHDEIAVSKIGSATFKTNFVANGYAEMNNLELHDARKQIKGFSGGKIYELLSNNKWHFIRSYFQNLHNHLNGHPSYINIPESMPGLSVFMARYNRVIFTAHLIFLPLLLYFFLSKFDQSSLVKVVFVGLPWLLIAFTSGIAVNQGDRLVLPGLLLCFVLYPLLFSYFWVRYQKR